MTDLILLRVQYAKRAVEKCLPQFGASLTALQHDNRARNISDLRSTMMHILRERTGLPLQAIGSIFKRDHASVIHNVKKVRNLLQTERGFAISYAEVDATLCEFLEKELHGSKSKK